MTLRFNNDYLEALFQGQPVPGKPKYDKAVILKFKKTILILVNTDSIAEIQKLNGLRFELLSGDYKGYCSVRVDKKYRLILSFEGDNILEAEALVIEELTNHYR